LGSEGFGTEYRHRNPKTGQLDGPVLRIDLAANAASLGARAIRATTHDHLRAALEESRREDRTTVIVVETDLDHRVPGYESWWDVPVAEVADMETVRRVRAGYEDAVKRERV
jgi:3D-(3,5/4)-trihydroxycyclohexane-1,2-dione acylhydrolase (decyclizing)